MYCKFEIFEIILPESESLIFPAVASILSTAIIFNEIFYMGHCGQSDSRK